MCCLKYDFVINLIMGDIIYVRISVEFNCYNKTRIKHFSTSTDNFTFQNCIELHLDNKQGYTDIYFFIF